MADYSHFLRACAVLVVGNLTFIGALVFVRWAFDTDSMPRWIAGTVQGIAVAGGLVALYIIVAGTF